MERLFANSDVKRGFEWSIRIVAELFGVGGFNATLFGKLHQSQYVVQWFVS